MHRYLIFIFDFIHKVLFLYEKLYLANIKNYFSCQKSYICLINVTRINITL